MARESAGILLFRDRAAPQVLLVHPGGPYWSKRDLGAWTIPKGELDADEDPRACALRELAEELGPAAPSLEQSELIELESIRQKGGKIVHAWAAEAEFDPAALDSNGFEMEWPPRSGERAEFPEVDRAEWFSPDEARRRIIAAQAELIDRLILALDG